MRSRTNAKTTDTQLSIYIRLKHSYVLLSVGFLQLFRPPCRLLAPSHSSISSFHCAHMFTSMDFYSLIQQKWNAVPRPHYTHTRAHTGRQVFAAFALPLEFIWSVSMTPVVHAAANDRNAVRNSNECRFSNSRSTGLTHGEDWVSHKRNTNKPNE